MNESTYSVNAHKNEGVDTVETLVIQLKLQFYRGVSEESANTIENQQMYFRVKNISIGVNFTYEHMWSQR